MSKSLKTISLTSQYLSPEAARFQNIFHPNHDQSKTPLLLHRYDSLDENDGRCKMLSYGASQTTIF